MAKHQPKMSAGFYQRYIPPPPAPKAKETASPPKAAFYNRYVPPATPAQSPLLAQIAEPALTENQEDAPPRKRRKHSPAEEREAKIAPTNSDKDHTPSRPNTVDESDDDGKHQRVKKKYKRALDQTAKRKDDPMEIDDNEESKEQPGVVKHGLEPIPQPMDIDERPAHIAPPLPDWMKESIRVNAEKRVDMASLGLSESTLQATTKAGYNEAFAIQTAVIPLMLMKNTRHDGDICVSASTGSGKTLAYVLPMIENLKDRPTRQLRGLIVVPTRDLVNQVKATLEQCAVGSGLQVGLAVGNRTIAQEKAALMEKVQVKDAVEYHRRRNMSEQEVIDEMMRTWDDVESDEDAAVEFEHVWKYISSIDILICTPGRLVDHMRNSKDFTLENIEMLVIDEADRLLDQSFQEWVEIVIPALDYIPDVPEQIKVWRLTRHIRPRRTMQKVILSATMTKDIGKLLSLKLENPKHVELKGKSTANGEVPDNEDQSFELPPALREIAVAVKETDEKPLILLRLLDDLLPTMPAAKSTNLSSEKAKPTREESTTDDSSSETSDTSPDESSSNDSSDDTSSSGSSSASSDAMEALETTSTPTSPSQNGVLIFTNSNESALRLSHLLTLLRPQWAKLTRSLDNTTKSSGRRTLSLFQSNKISILVATDRASRGIDIKDLTTVINYDMPTSLQSYVHRVGRTARAGRPGNALTLVDGREAGWFWDKIGRAKEVRREGKIERRKGVGKEVGLEEKGKYAEALKKLGAEARSGR